MRKIMIRSDYGSLEMVPSPKESFGICPGWKSVTALMATADAREGIKCMEVQRIYSEIVGGILWPR